MMFKITKKMSLSATHSWSNQYYYQYMLHAINILMPVVISECT